MRPRPAKRLLSKRRHPEILIENIRCFSGFRRVALRPLTILVGENSSGKSTFLGAIAAAFNPLFPSPKRVFSVPPYDLSNFQSVATYRGGRGGRSNAFSLGFRPPPGNSAIQSVTATYESDRGQHVLRRIRFATDVGFIEVEVKKGDSSASATLVNRREKRRRKVRIPDISDEFFQDFPLPTLMFYLFDRLKPEEQKALFDEEPHNFRRLYLSFRAEFSGRPPTSLAPARTKPKRTYDQLTEEFRPEGDHIPLVLAQIWQKKDDRTEAIREALIGFGKETGLFDGIEPKSLGPGGGPFQILVKISGPPKNLSDVGYGVSQSLPVVVESVLRPGPELLLMQQPEVHLHPKAQSALGTFFSRLVASRQKRFVIETHSDFLLDRVRQEVAKGTIKNDDVGILYFERKRNETTIHELRLDANGTIENPPANYRKFFIDEELSLLQRAR